MLVCLALAMTRQVIVRMKIEKLREKSAKYEAEEMAQESTGNDEVKTKGKSLFQRFT